jgi:hypothetical protein
MSKEIILYEKMVVAIDQCHKTDQVKEIRDKALALEHYARQTQSGAELGPHAVLNPDTSQNSQSPST